MNGDYKGQDGKHTSGGYSAYQRLMQGNKKPLSVRGAFELHSTCTLTLLGPVVEGRSSLSPEARLKFLSNSLLAFSSPSIVASTSTFIPLMNSRPASRLCSLKPSGSSASTAFTLSSKARFW